MMLGMLILDRYWWMIIPGLVLGIYAQFKLMSTYRKYLEVPIESGYSGAEAARIILDRGGLQEVPIEEVPGQLSDHYDPTSRKLCLSTDNFHGRSLSAVGVAAHEAGHALQHRDSYAMLKLRMAMAPATQFASMAYAGLSILGFFLGMAIFLKFLGIIIGLFTVITVFQIITLPVEFNASSRAKVELNRLGLVSAAEAPGVSKVLSAAAMTYVAGMVTGVMQLLHFVLLARDRD